MAAAPQITTLIPTYRRPHLLRRAIRSALNQSYPHVQVWVYDNASGDATAEVVAECMREDPRVHYHCHANNIGMLGNFNYAIEHVTTPYFSILSDDDILLPTFYEVVLKGFEQHPEAAFSAGAVIQITDDGRVLRNPMEHWEREGCYLPPEGIFAMVGERFPTITGILFRQEVVPTFGSFDRDIAMSDITFCMRIAAQRPFVVAYQPCALFVSHESSLTYQADPLYTWQEWQKIMQRLADDRHIPTPVRPRFSAVLHAFVCRTMLLLSLRALSRQDFAGTHAAAYILQRHYGLFNHARLLDIVAVLCAINKPFFHIFLNSYNIYRKLKNQRRQTSFENYTLYLGS
jgi:glycosyltransferase involved in cell wall biosynthesis